MTVFVDTNVLLDTVLRREPHWKASAAIWTLAETGQLRAYASAISYNNLYYIARKLSDPSKAREALRLVRAVFRTVPMDDRLIDRALASGIGDFEDAVQYESARIVKATHLITGDCEGFPRGEPAVVTPVEFLARRGAIPSR